MPVCRVRFSLVVSPGTVFLGTQQSLKFGVPIANWLLHLIQIKMRTIQPLPSEFSGDLLIVAVQGGRHVALRLSYAIIRRFNAITAAYEVLSDADSRQIYGNARHTYKKSCSPPPQTILAKKNMTVNGNFTKLLSVVMPQLLSAISTRRPRT